MTAVLMHNLPLHSAVASLFVMNTERRYSIILEHSAEVLLEHAPMAQIEAFWDANDTRYFGLRMEDEHSAHARVIVTDEVPDDEDVALF
ncbi:hypothetical protein OKW12_004813 [Pseudomonas silensiensis]|jgi:hypothetical protein|uniref:Uncharacterized protein n=4 Tax=Pseudomonas fluorescens group TaxID=136843 RepID=A0ABY0VGZ4_9PSED|nr:hypothetical protein [Pseudomonas silensiensis]SDU23922.1 hypothetical protein SAMN04489801_1697 [Pseudomonas mandelii]VVO73228.1 hypothetical protein PS870_01402 [Pseudomonas fluorescens]